jgi:hypothetical protein
VVVILSGRENDSKTLLSQRMTIAALLCFILRYVSSPICRFVLDRSNQKMDGETDRPSLPSSRRTFSCVIQRPFSTAFPFAVALPNYQVIRWWGNKWATIRRVFMLD